MSDWHPLLATVEVEPGRWEMRGYEDRLYGEIRIVRVRGEVGYKAEFVDRDGTRELVGWYRSLRASCENVHARFIARHTSRPTPHMLGSVR